MKNLLLLSGLLLASSTMYAQSGFSIGVSLGNRGSNVPRIYHPPPPPTNYASSYRPGMYGPHSAWNDRGSYDYRVRTNEQRPQYRGVRINPVSARFAPRDNRVVPVDRYVRR